MYGLAKSYQTNQWYVTRFLWHMNDKIIKCNKDLKEHLHAKENKLTGNFH